MLVDHLRRSVRLTDERREHILQHPEMTGVEDQLEITLRDPELVIRQSSDPRITLSYRFRRGTLVGDKWLCVVVKYIETDAFVLTAYLTDKPKQGDRLWPRT